MIVIFEPPQLLGCDILPFHFFFVWGVGGGFSIRMLHKFQLQLED